MTELCTKLDLGLFSLRRLPFKIIRIRMIEYRIMKNCQLTQSNSENIKSIINVTFIMPSHSEAKISK